MHSKLAKRVLGAMISAAVMVSMIPAMALADDEVPAEDTGIIEVDAAPTSQISAGSNRTRNGINVAVTGSSSNIGANWGIGVGTTEAGGTYTFKIDETTEGQHPYAGGVITQIDIDVTNCQNCEMAESGNEGWSPLTDAETGELTDILTWSGTPASSVSLNMVATGSGNHTLGYSSITVYVQVPVTAVTVEPDDVEEYDYMYVEESYHLNVIVAPDNTTFTELTWTSSDEEVASISWSDAGAAILYGEGPGTATITGAIGGMSGTYDITVYDHVAGVTISDTEETLNVGYTMGLEAYPTNKSDVRAEDWTVEFTSSNPDIASVTVVDGIAQVDALKEGTAVITATVTDYSQPTGDDEDPYETYTATCTITVTDIDTVVIYRMYNPATSEHLYTANEGERDSLINNGWRYEAPAWIAPSISNTPVFRLYNPNADGGDHVYSSNEGEIASLEAAGWRNEGIAFYSDDFERMTVYRVYDSGSTERNHHYSVDQGEIDWLVGLGYTNEGPALYGIGLYNEAT